MLRGSCHGAWDISLVLKFYTYTKIAQLKGGLTPPLHIALHIAFKRDGVALEVFEIDEFQRMDVGGFQNDRAGDTGLEGLFPAGDTDTPTVPGFQSWKTVQRKGGDKVVTNRLLMGEKLGCHLAADGVKSFVIGAGIAATVAVETRQRFERAGL